jgi:serine/threonine-protein kinase RsbW
MQTSTSMGPEKVLLLDYTMPSQVVMFGNLAVSVEDAIPDLPDIAFSANLCLEELITNTIQYGLGNAPDRAIRIFISRSPDCLEIVVRDDAPPFDPFNSVPTPDIDAGVDERDIGGLGVHLVRTLMDEAWATYDGTGNLITLKKTLKQ